MTTPAQVEQLRQAFLATDASNAAAYDAARKAFLDARADMEAHRIHTEELMAGQRAPFHVYYKHGTKNMYTPAYPTTLTPEAARDWANAAFRELRMRNVTIIRVVATQGPLVR